MIQRRWTTFHELQFIRRMASDGKTEVLKAMLTHVWTRDYGEVDRRDVYHELEVQLDIRGDSPSARA